MINLFLRDKKRALQRSSIGGPGENRTRASAMRMRCNTTLLQAQKLPVYYTRFSKKANVILESEAVLGKSDKIGSDISFDERRQH